MTAARKLEETKGRAFFDYEDSASPDMQRLYGRMLHADLVLFAKDILRLEIGPHLVAWGDLVATTQRIAVNAARDHSKSTFFSYAYPIWRAWSEPGCEVYLFSKTLDQAAEFLDIILYGRANLRGMVDIPELQHLVPSTGTVGKRDPRARMNRTDVRLTNGSRIRVAGYGKAMRGRHPKYIVLDDPLNDEDMWSETTRRKNTEYFKSAITNMLPPDGQLIVVGTPYHMNDLYGFLRQNEMYTFVRYPAILKDIDGKERALFPWRWTLERLHSKKKEIGSVAFAREILCCKPGTLIETEHGAQPIELVTVGTRVLTHTGRWQRVLRCMQHEHDGSLIRIKGSLHVTPNHPVLTQEGWLYADQLATTDQVTFPIPTIQAEPRQSLSLIAETRVPYLLTADKQRAYVRGSATHIASGSVGKSGAKSVPVELPLTASLMRLLGLWLAEGHVSNGKTIVWSFGLHEQDTLVRETVDLIYAVLGLRAQVSVNEAGGTAVVIVGSRLFADMLLREFGTGAANKRIPLWLRDLAPALIWPLVLGYADGDGYVDAGTSFRVSSVSQALLVSIRYLLARCGIFSSLRQVSSARAGVIQGRNVTLRASWMLSVTGGGYLAFKSRQLPARSFSWSRLHTGCEQIPYAGQVFNIEVEHDNSYVADGVAVHNCQPVSDDISIFPSFLFPPCYDHKLTLRMSRADIQRMGWTCFMGVDIARSASVSADFFVVFVVAKAPDGRHVIVDISRTKGLSFNAQLELMKSIAERYDPALIHIESNAAQQVYSDEMRRTTDLPVKEFVTLASNKYPLDRGVPSLRLLLESGKLVIPRGDERSRQITDAWIEECTQFGFIDGKMQGIGAHDDMVMGWWLAEEAVKAGGFSFTFGENGDDKSADDEMTGGGADGENWLDVLVGKDDGDARDDLDFGSLGSQKTTPAMMPGTF